MFCIVPLHSEIRDVHRLAADVDYFLRARMLHTLHSEIRDVHRLAANVDYFLRARMLRTLHPEINKQKYGAYHCSSQHIHYTKNIL